MMIANMIEHQFKNANDWPFGAALSFLLMYMTFLAMACRGWSPAAGECAAVSALARESARRAAGVLAPLADPGLAGAVFFFLYAPLITLMAFSFNNFQRNIVWRGFTLHYYAAAFADADLITAFGNSLTIAAISTAGLGDPGGDDRPAAVAVPVSVQGRAGGRAGPAHRRAGDLHGRGHVGVLYPGPALAHLAAWPLNLGRDHHLAHLVFVQLRGHRIRGSPGLVQPRTGGGGQGPWAPASGGCSGMSSSRTCVQACWPGPCWPSPSAWMIS